MKHPFIITLALLMSVPALSAMAGPASMPVPESVAVGPVSMPKAEFDQLKAMVSSGVYHPPLAGSNRPDVLSGEIVELTAADTESLRSVMAGEVVTSGYAPSTVEDPSVSLGLISMPRSEFEALRRLTAPYHVMWETLIADMFTGNGASIGK